MPTPNLPEEPADAIDLFDGVPDSQYSDEEVMRAFDIVQGPGKPVRCRDGGLYLPEPPTSVVDETSPAEVELEKQRQDGVAPIDSAGYF